MGAVSKLGWYAQRLRKMSPQEVAHRARDQAQKVAWSRLQVRAGDVDVQQPMVARTLFGGAPVVPLADRRFRTGIDAHMLLGAPETARSAVLEAADEVMSGDMTVLGTARHDLKAPDWFYDPVTGRRAPQHLYCFKVEHRNEELTGNIKQVWELSRLHHLPVLAAAYNLSGEDAYAVRAADHLTSWWEENPFLSGANWTSGIELGIRLISWAWARRLLSPWPKAAQLFEDNPRALDQIWWHQYYLSSFVSRGSSANNHVIAEAAGQLVASLAFPWFPQSARWASRSAVLLERELVNNTFPSGVNREMAFEYHGLVAELALVAGAEADLAGQPLGSRTWQLLCSMLDVVAATVDAGLNPPRYGDGDDGHALVLSPDANRFASLLSAGREIFGAPEWWPATPVDVFSVLLSSLAERRLVEGRPQARPSDFEDAGLTLLRSPAGQVPEIWCRCDAGPQGFLSIAAHGHADALSLEVRYDGTEVLSDPGTYCYHGEGRWRQYFRSTVGHNTLEIDGVDQSASGGPFLWSRQAECRRLDVDTTDSEPCWEAEHLGYQALPSPVVHRRTVSLDPTAQVLIIVDRTIVAHAQTDGEHEYRLAFHFGPTVEVELGDGVARLQVHAGVTVHQATMNLASELSWQLARGEENPVMGWYSARFGQKAPIFALVGRGHRRGPATFTTRLRFPTEPGL